MTNEEHVRLTEIVERCMEAAPGDLNIAQIEQYRRDISERGCSYTMSPVSITTSVINAELYAHARDDMLWLVEIVERLDADLEAGNEARDREMSSLRRAMNELERGYLGVHGRLIVLEHHNRQRNSQKMDNNLDNILDNNLDKNLDNDEAVKIG